MQTDDDTNILLSRVRYPESLKLQLNVFQAHLTEVNSVIQSLSRYSPTEVDSFWFIKKLIVAKIKQLKKQIATIEKS